MGSSNWRLVFLVALLTLAAAPLASANQKWVRIQELLHPCALLRSSYCLNYYLIPYFNASGKQSAPSAAQVAAWRQGPQSYS